MSGFYYSLTALLAVAAVIGTVALKLRQPLIVAFIVTGMAVGPVGLGWVQPEGQLEVLASIGVTVLLFTVGLKLDMRLVRRLGPVALATGLGQLAFTIVFGYAIALALSMTALEALYVAVALTFSSTIIIVKLLSDKRELDSLHGRIALGFLIVQDIAVVVAMMVLGSFKGGVPAPHWAFITLSVVARMMLALGVVAVLMRYVLPPVMRLVARSQELMVIFGVAWGTALAALGELAGFSMEVGAFLAGFSLASSDFREAMSSRLASVRDFLLLFFFVELGAGLELHLLGDQLIAAAVLSVFVLIGNPLIVMAIMGYMGYRRRTGFLAGLTVAQISEFSIVFTAMGITLGHVDDATLGLVTLVGMVTITLSTYMILYSHVLYRVLEPWLGRFEREHPHRELIGEDGSATTHTVRPEVLVYGLGRYGGRLLRQLAHRGVAAVGVDFDPRIVGMYRRRGIDVRYGDAEDPDYVQALPLASVRLVVSTVPSPEVNATLMRSLREHDYRGEIDVVAHEEEDAAYLRRLGVTRVLQPFLDAADFAASRITEGTPGREVTP